MLYCSVQRKWADRKTAYQAAVANASPSVAEHGHTDELVGHGELVRRIAVVNTIRAVRIA
jgi:hypothetical protein